MVSSIKIGVEDISIYGVEVSEMMLYINTTNETVERAILYKENGDLIIDRNSEEFDAELLSVINQVSEMRNPWRAEIEAAEMHNVEKVIGGLEELSESLTYLSNSPQASKLFGTEGKKKLSDAVDSIEGVLTKIRVDEFMERNKINLN